MSVQTPLRIAKAIKYPDGDGQGMLGNSLVFPWITMVVGSLQTLFHDNRNVSVGGDLFDDPTERDDRGGSAPALKLAQPGPEPSKTSNSRFHSMKRPERFSTTTALNNSSLLGK